MVGVEKRLLEEISMETPKVILERFGSLVRESGSEDERQAAQFLTSLLDEWGVPYQVHRPNLYLSVPRPAKLKLVQPVEKEIRAKNPAFSVITGDDWREGELVYIPTGFKKKWDNQKDSSFDLESGSLTGKIVLTEGFPRPARIRELNEMGIIGAIFIHPGKNIHESICTPIWGAPDLDTYENVPKLPVLMINRSDGQELIDQIARDKVEVQFQTHLDQGWFPCPLIDIFIEGTEEKDKYVLLHGHMDSWHQGLGDNATGNAAMIEMARVFYQNRGLLKRSLRIAIWPGHSTGRYAGSTWFADTFGLDLDENCMAQVNCDSPGCRWATSYHEMSWMSEVNEFCQTTIKEAIGEESIGHRPPRAGDYSFHNIGLTAFYMLSSSIPEEVLQEKGYYPVGGCGSNIEWHTEEDLIHIIDYEILERDVQVYTASLYRIVNNTVHPFQFVNTVDEFIKTLETYQEAAGKHFSFKQAFREAYDLRSSLVDFYDRIASFQDRGVLDPAVQKANDVLRELSRTLVPINFTRRGKFWHDPAVDIPPLPDIAPATTLPQLEEGTHRYHVTLTHLTRGQNRLAWTLHKAKRIVQS
ncbi:M28 family peptidase [Brevibacillus choshinensis]|uniref:M28 family peptidase n=1 Tax=Brevibacillus choshinensis TaxID=54911 RepID=UPI002E200826|nr:M28 family peptidase [Brevibacillus choshinensis]